MITKTKTKTKKNELVWLEKGNKIKALKHIIDGHEIVRLEKEWE